MTCAEFLGHVDIFYHRVCTDFGTTEFARSLMTHRDTYVIKRAPAAYDYHGGSTEFARSLHGVCAEFGTTEFGRCDLGES